MPSLLHPLAITSMCLIPAAHAALPLDDPALAEDLKTYITSLDPTKPEDCIGFVNRHLSDILYTRFTHKSVLEDELAPHEKHSRNGLPQEQDAQGHLEGGDPQARGGRARLPVVGALGMGDEGQAVSSEAFPPTASRMLSPMSIRRSPRIRSRSNPPPSPKHPRRPPAHSVRSAGRASGRIL